MKDLGFVNRIVAHEKLLEETMDLADRLSKGPALVYQRTKRLFLDAIGTDFEVHLKKERMIQVESAKSEDYAIGVKAIIEKKKPSFT